MPGIERIASGQSIGLVLAGAVAFAAAFWFRLPHAPQSDRAASLEVNATLGGDDEAGRTTNAFAGMVLIPGGEFVMGSNASGAWPDEKPAHRVSVSGFWMDATEVTNQQFAEFVAATGYVTTAERTPTVEEILANSPEGTPPPSPDLLVAGSLVFTPPDSQVPLNDVRRWWTWTPGANWKCPEGPDSNLEQRNDHPVVHV